MLNAKKIKLHGMHSKKWTIKDKLTQYKGLLNLYRRDRKILEFDTNVSRKKQLKEVRELQKSVNKYRDELDNAIRGDRQALRNVLAEHRNLQLAYQDLHPNIVIEHIDQDIFILRKELDRIRYKLKLKSQILIDLKLELAELGDRLKQESIFGQTKEEMEAQLITGKVQDAILKREAAVVVKNTYKSILDIMEKDSVYFNAVLDTLKDDAIAQGRCMFKTTELGQLATEYLDDRKDEFLQLEKCIKADMKVREKELDKIQGTVAQLSKNVKNLLRRDSDVTIIKRNVVVTTSMEFMQEDINGMEELLARLKIAFKVPAYNYIYPCLLEQHRQSERLKEYADVTTNYCDIIRVKYFHAKKMYSTLFFTMADTTLEYRADKKSLKTQIGDEVNKRDSITKLIDKRGTLIINIRKSLQCIFQSCKHVNMGESHMKALTIQGDGNAGQLENVPEDGNVLVEEIYKRLTVLLPQYAQISPEIQYYVGLNYVEMVHQYTRLIDPLEKPPIESLVDMNFDDSRLPTRETVKANSDAIVRENLKLDIEQTVIPKRRKKWKF